MLIMIDVGDDDDDDDDEQLQQEGRCRGSKGVETTILVFALIFTMCPDSPKSLLCTRHNYLRKVFLSFLCYKCIQIL